MTSHLDTLQATSGRELFRSHKDETDPQIVLRTYKCPLILLVF